VTKDVAEFDGLIKALVGGKLKLLRFLASHRRVYRLPGCSRRMGVGVHRLPPIAERPVGWCQRVGCPTGPLEEDGRGCPPVAPPIGAAFGDGAVRRSVARERRRLAGAGQASSGISGSTSIRSCVSDSCQPR
jgi:hypothetical protein